jgi:hypothetical protein
MDDLFERLVSLLGQPHDGKVFKQFIEDLGEEPDVLPPPAPPDYDFNRAGFSVSTDGRNITEIFAVIRTPTYARTNESGLLPSGLTDSDRRIDVRRKLGKPAGSGQNRKTKELIDHYKISEVIVTLKFDSDDQQITTVRIYVPPNRPK